MLHAILPVKVKRKGRGDSVTTYALYDNGSGGCFATESIRKQLGVEGVRTVLRLATMHGKSQVESNVMIIPSSYLTRTQGMKSQPIIARSKRLIS